MTELRSDLATQDANPLVLSSTVGEAPAAASLRREVDAARQARDQAIARANAAERALQNAQREAAAARQDAALAQLERQAVLQSSSWRLTTPWRMAGRAIPRRSRQATAKLARLARWALAGQLLRRLTNRRGLAARAEQVAGSGLFDAAWYTANNPDVASSGLSPALHYAAHGAAEGRDPGPAFHVRTYLHRHPGAAGAPGGALFHALAHGTAGDGAPTEDVLSPSVDTLVRQKFPYLNRIPVFAAPRAGGRRITVVLDSMGPNHLYGGVGTAMILASLAARRLGAQLRFVTRSEPADPARVGAVLNLHGAAYQGNIDFLHTPRDGSANPRMVPISADDRFITTSWWSTWSTAQSVARSRIAYLLQEDERMFYPFGDDQLRCADMLADPNLLYLVNSRLLLEHLHRDGMAPGAVAFEPAFPRAVYQRAATKAGAKQGFFFYARPLNDRNLYWRGLETLAAAIEDGVLDPKEWDFHFAGHGAQNLSLPLGARPIFPGPMPWSEYGAFIGRMELGLSLMGTPHPSYPPLDLAASGAVVVTNRFGIKRSLDHYSRNIICADLGVPALLEGLRSGKALAADHAARAANLAQDGLQRDWSQSLAPALDRLTAWAEA